MEIDMPLYPIDIEKRLKALQRQARYEAEGAPYIVYALLDPGEPGVQFAEGPFNGIPFYVGQSCEIERRLRRHFRKSQKLNPDSQMVHRHIAGLFAIGRLPRLAILETAQTRSQSLMAELRWGQRLMRDGYELANTSPDIGRIMGVDELTAWLDFRRSSMLASEAAREGVVIVHNCTCGHVNRWIDPADYTACWPKRLRVSKIANLTQQCPGCGEDCEWWLDDRELLAIHAESDAVSHRLPGLRISGRS
jgi:hypothetical protein